jgi:Protein of unknown function (DUF1524)
VNAREMQCWLIQSLLLGVFAGQSDRTIALARAAIRESLKIDRGFPSARLYEALATAGRIAQLDGRAVEEVLALEHGKPKTILALSLLYDDIDWHSTTFHVDHIVAKAQAERRLLQGANLPEHRIKEITANIDRLGNLQLLPSGENIEKSDLSFDSWITSRDRYYLERHLIPDRLDLATAAMLPDFVREREKLIRRRLQRFMTRVPA